MSKQVTCPGCQGKGAWRQKNKCEKWERCRTETKNGFQWDERTGKYDKLFCYCRGDGDKLGGQPPLRFFVVACKGDGYIWQRCERCGGTGRIYPEP